VGLNPVTVNVSSVLMSLCYKTPKDDLYTLNVLILWKSWYSENMYTLKALNLWNIFKPYLMSAIQTIKLW